jgi:type I restriction enzyme, S subunit
MAVQVKDKVEPEEADVDRYVGLEHIDPESLKIRRWGEPSDVESSKILFRSGDIIFGKRRAYQRKLAVADVDGICSAHAMVLRPKTDVVLEEFLPFFMQSDIFMDRAVKISVGGLSPTINWRDLAKEEFALPPLEEQRRIAEILDAADTLRAKYSEAFAQLDTLLQSTFLHMFGDPDTNPKGWEQSPLGQLCGVGSSKRVFVSEFVEEGIPFYRGTEVGSLGEGEALTPTLFITHDHYEQLKRHSGVPRPGDLLLPSICPDGRIFIVQDDKPFYFKDGRVLWIKAGESGINSTFLLYFLKAVFVKAYSKIASGSTFAELKIFALKNLVVYVPPREEQDRFTKVFESIEGQKARMRSHLVELDALFASLQSRAFNGELLEARV